MIKMTNNNDSINILRRQQGVHIHLFGINNSGKIISTLILTRTDNGLRGIVSGKIEAGESTIEAAKRELYEETRQIPLSLFDTGKRLLIKCKKYEFQVSVFAGLTPHNSTVILNNENKKYAFVPTVFSLSNINIAEQRENQTFCINKAREMYQTMMN
ncbi:NUDIX domain-containing protein [Candidatus Latescibacterota bacterium]